MLKQFRNHARIIIHPPSISQRTIDTLEVEQTPSESSKYVFPSDTVSTLLDTRGNPLQRQLRRFDFQICDFYPITGYPPFLEPRCMGNPAQRCFEGEARAGGRQPVQLSEKSTSRRHCSDFGPQCGETHGDEVCVNKMNDIGVFWKEFTGKRRLARTVWSGDDDAARLSQDVGVVCSAAPAYLSPQLARILSIVPSAFILRNDALTLSSIALSPLRTAMPTLPTSIDL